MVIRTCVDAPSEAYAHPARALGRCERILAPHVGVPGGASWTASSTRILRVGGSRTRVAASGTQRPEPALMTRPMGASGGRLVGSAPLASTPSLFSSLAAR
jgi:hypothetical protein